MDALLALWEKTDKSNPLAFHKGFVEFVNIHPNHNLIVLVYLFYYIVFLWAPPPSRETLDTQMAMVRTSLVRTVSTT